MHQHRTDSPAGAAGGVSGLGICDALRVELAPGQLPWLLEEIDETRSALEQARIGGGPEPSPESSLDYRIRLLRLLRDRLPSEDESGPVVLTGPGPLVSDLVRGTMRHAIQTLAELALGGTVERPDTHPRLVATAAAASAWVRTFVACRELEAFNFDPQADPVQ